MDITSTPVNGGIYRLPIHEAADRQDFTLSDKLKQVRGW